MAVGAIVKKRVRIRARRRQARAAIRDRLILEVPWLRLLDLPDVEVNEAHREHVVREKGELVLAVRVVGFEGIP